MAHPRVIEMKEDLKNLFFLKGMKANIVSYVVRCLECQLVKVENRYPIELLQPHAIPESKWEVISMEFIVVFSLTARRHDSIFVVVDTLAKSVLSTQHTLREFTKFLSFGYHFSFIFESEFVS